MGKTGKIILTVAIIFGAFLLVAFMVGRDGQGGALHTVINGVINTINGWVSNFTANEVKNLIPEFTTTP